MCYNDVMCCVCLWCASHSFEKLFTTLDEQKTSLGISSWGASVTTMEEVFLK